MQNESEEKNFLFLKNQKANAARHDETPKRRAGGGTGPPPVSRLLC